MGNNKYTHFQKLAVVSDARATSISAAATKHKVDRKRIRDWMKAEDMIAQATQESFRMPGGGRKLTSQALEELLLERIRNLRIEIVEG